MFIDSIATTFLNFDFKSKYKNFFQYLKFFFVILKIYYGTAIIITSYLLGAVGNLVKKFL